MPRDLLRRSIVCLLTVALMMGGSLIIFSDFAVAPGQPWPSTRLTDLQHNSYSPDVAVCAEGAQCENTHVVWMEEVQPNGGTQIYYMKGIGRGVAWSQQKAISADVHLMNGHYDQRAINPSVAVWDNTIHVVFAKWSESQNEWRVYYQRSNNNGQDWLASDLQLSGPSVYGYDDVSLDPSVAATEDFVHVVYSIQYLNDDVPIIRYRRAVGPTWSWFLETEISEDNDLAIKVFPDVVCSGSNVHVSWAANYNHAPFYKNSVYYNRSEDNGQTWVYAGSIEEMLTSPLTERRDADGLSISASGANVHVVFSHVKRYETTYRVYYQRSTDNGNNWFTDPNPPNLPLEKKISVGDSDSRYPSIGTSAGLLSVVYEIRESGTYVPVVHIGSRDNGDTWGEYEQVSPSRPQPGTSLSELPSISLSGNDRHVVFQDYTGDNWEIYYASDMDSATFYPYSLLSPRWASCAVGVGTTVYLFGGEVGTPGSSYSDDILKDSGGGWLPAGTLPEFGRSQMSCAYDGGQYIYIFGGEKSGGKTSQIVRYDTVTETATKLVGVTLPTERSKTSAAFDSSQYIYIFGGTDDTGFLDDILKFDTISQSSPTITATLPSARAGTAAVWDPREGTEGHGYVFGGETSGGNTDQIVEFNPVGGAPTVINSLPTQVVPSSAVWDDTHAYVFYDDRIVRYDPKTNMVFTMCVRLPYEISSAPAAMQDIGALGGRRALLVGGIYSSGQMEWTSNEVVSYEASYWGY